MKKTGIRLSLAALLFLAGCKGGTSSLSMTEVSSVPASSAPASSVVPVEKVTCIFQNYDNSELWRTKIDLGSDVTYGGEEPTKPDTTAETYSFTGWDKPLTAIKQDTVFNAQYSAIARTYTVNFYLTAEDAAAKKNSLYTTYPLYNTTVLYAGEVIPSKATTGTAYYHWVGWDKDPATTPIVADTDFIAKFDEYSYTLTDYTFEAKDATNAQYLITGYTGSAKALNLPPVNADGKPVVGVKANAFKNKTAIQSFITPDSYTALGDSAFEGCTALKTVTLNDQIDTLGTAVFKGTGLTAFAVPKSVSALMNNAFQNCAKLTEMTFPVLDETLTSIGDYALAGTGFTTFRTPQGVNLLGAHCFDGCTALKYVIAEVDVKTMGDDLLANCTALEAFYYNGVDVNWKNAAHHAPNDVLFAKYAIFSQTAPTDTDYRYWHWTDEEQTVPALWTV